MIIEWICVNSDTILLTIWSAICTRLSCSSCSSWSWSIKNAIQILLGLGWRNIISFYVFLCCDLLLSDCFNQSRVTLVSWGNTLFVSSLKLQLRISCRCFLKLSRLCLIRQAYFIWHKQSVFFMQTFCCWFYMVYFNRTLCSFIFLWNLFVDEGKKSVLIRSCVCVFILY